MAGMPQRRFSYRQWQKFPLSIVMASQDHYWLRTSDYRAVLTDQKGEYRLKWEPGYVGIEFMEEETPGNRQGEMGTRS
jgi:hypothetical protein